MRARVVSAWGVSFLHLASCARNRHRTAAVRMSAYDIIAKLDGDLHRIAQGRHHDPDRT
ncbi:MAG: hypothetical protein ACT4O5_17510 [Gammaproteobacteria bacterium]